jgi:hypothetical protein
MRQCSVNQSASEIADHELGCILLNCWLENANDHISIETAAGQLCNKMHDLVNGRLQVVTPLASCLARSGQPIQRLFVEHLVHEVHATNLLNLTRGYAIDEASTILLSLSDFQHETVGQLVGMVVQADGETLTSLSNGLVGTIFICIFLQNDSLSESRRALIVGVLLPLMPDIARNRRGALVIQVSWDVSDMEIRQAIQVKISSGLIMSDSLSKRLRLFGVLSGENSGRHRAQISAQHIWEESPPFSEPFSIGMATERVAPDVNDRPPNAGHEDPKKRKSAGIRMVGSILEARSGQKQQLCLVSKLENNHLN